MTFPFCPWGRERGSSEPTSPCEAFPAHGNPLLLIDDLKCAWVLMKCVVSPGQMRAFHCHGWHCPPRFTLSHSDFPRNLASRVPEDALYVSCTTAPTPQLHPLLSRAHEATSTTGPSRKHAAISSGVCAQARAAGAWGLCVLTSVRPCQNVPR